MVYRKFGNMNYNISAISFGAMRLPTKEGETPGSSVIDEKEAILMIRTAIDNGVNYVDTAYGYHSGESEVVVGKALKEGYREKVYVATKSPVFSINAEEDFERILDTQLKKLDVGYIDFYMFHALNADRWENVVLKYDLLSKIEKAKAAGKIKHIGFSFHDNYAGFDKIMNGYDKWEFCQIQLNYLDAENQAGVKGMKQAAERGMGVIIMEPLLGGKLAAPAKKITELFTKQNSDRTPVEWALDWLWDMPQVSFLLSGMSTMKQVTDNITYAARSSVGMLSAAELATVEAVQKKFKAIKAVPCTKCSYCMPCPNNVNIPRNFEIYNELFMYENEEGCRKSYVNLAKSKEGNKSAESCISCGVCEAMCPQKIEIAAMMPKVHEELAFSLQK